MMRHDDEPSWSRNSGAALVELMIYLALAATILVTVNEGLQLFEHGASRSLATTERGARLDSLSSKLSDLIESIARVPIRRDKKLVFAFSGTRSRISFPIDDGAGISMGELSVIETRNGNAKLIVNIGTRQRVLFDGAYSIRFSYRAERHGDTGWLTRWPEQGRMPDLIRLEIRDARGVSVATPFVTALMRDAETACNEPTASDCTINTSGELTWTPG